MLMARFLCFCIALLISTTILFGISSDSFSVISLIRLIFSTAVTVSSFVSWVVIHALTYTFVLAVECCKVATDSLHNLFCFVAATLRSFAGILFDTFLDAAASAAKSAVKFMVEEVPRIGGAALGASMELMEKTRKGLEILVETMPLIVEAVVEAVKEVVESLWSTYEEALQFVTERKFNVTQRFR